MTRDSQEPEARFDHLFELAYEELRRLAAHVGRPQRHPSLNPTALVNEVYLKLKRAKGIEPQSELHFKRMAAQAMRQVLVDACREKSAAKRDAELEPITVCDEKGQLSFGMEKILLLDDALGQLHLASPRQALLFECRFFGGLTGAEAAKLLEVSEATVDRDWRAAKAWLGTQLRPS